MTADRAVRLRFAERLAGPFELRSAAGRRTLDTLSLDLGAGIADVAEFVADPDRSATITGTIALPGMDERLPCSGALRLFPPVPAVLMIYEIGFRHGGERYQLVGHKSVRFGAGAAARPERGPRQAWHDTTTLHVRLWRGGAGGVAAGAGVVRIRATGVARMLASMRTSGTRNPLRAVGALAAFAWLFVREVAARSGRRPSDSAAGAGHAG